MRPISTGGWETPGGGAGSGSESESESGARGVGGRRSACLLLHGLGGGTYELEPVRRALEGAGILVEAPVLPGHEGPGPRMPASRWTDWLEAAERARDRLAERAGPGARIDALGFSTGGTLALALAARRPLDRLVLAAPFFRIKYSDLIPVPPEKYLGMLARVAPNLPRRPPAARERAARRELAGASPFRTFSVPATLSALELIDRVRTITPTLTNPTLILQGRRDSVVDPSGAAWLMESLGSPHDRKWLEYLQRSDHLVFHDRDRERALELTLRHLAEE